MSMSYPFLTATLINSFASRLAGKRIVRFAPPFRNYSVYPRDIITFLDDFFRDYLREVKRLGTPDVINELMRGHMWLAARYLKLPPLDYPVKFDLYAECKELCEAIKGALECYFRGYPNEAYEVFERLLTDNHQHMLLLLPRLESNGGGVTLYRMRSGGHREVKDLFHVPFDKREYCASYRFSIAGVPALYCAASIHTCVLENNNFEGNKSGVVTAVRFNLPNARFVDLALSPVGVRTLWEQYSLILYYPLIVACGLKVRNPKAYFKPEYVIPQILYQVLRKHYGLVDGISFTSTRYDVPDFTDYAQRNFVVFVYGTLLEFGYNRQFAKCLTAQGPVVFPYPGTDIKTMQKDISQCPPKPINI